MQRSKVSILPANAISRSKRKGLESVPPIISILAFSVQPPLREIELWVLEVSGRTEDSVLRHPHGRLWLLC